jgi:serine phosphatase RsbU (regulator of sigma subunit)
MALFRSAFIVAFSVVASAAGAGTEAFVAWGCVYFSALYTVIVFAVWWLRRRAPIPWQRPCALLVDIIVISGVIASYGYTASGVKDCYYVIIFAAGMWFRMTGAVLVGLVTALAYVSAYSYASGISLLSLSLSSAVQLLYDSGAIFMPAAGFVMGMLFTAYARELQRLAEIEHEIELARRLQDYLLPPTPPTVRGWEIAVGMKRARQVGGDFYTFCPFRDDSVLLALADMAGKSVHGLVHLSLLHSHLAAVAEVASDLASVANEVNRRAYPQLQPYSYAAVVLIALSPDNDEVEFVNCGHLPPIIVAPDSTVMELTTDDPIIGARKNHVYTQRRARVQPGAVLVCYTDGLVETRNSSGEVFGEERLRHLIVQHAGLPAQRVCEAVLARVAEFGPEGPNDDQTVVVLRRLAPDEGV